MEVWRKKLKRIVRRLKGSTMPSKMNKKFAYTTMVKLSSMANKTEEKAQKLSGEAKKQALKQVQYFRSLAKEISELI